MERLDGFRTSGQRSRQGIIRDSLHPIGVLTFAADLIEIRAPGKDEIIV